MYRPDLFEMDTTLHRRLLLDIAELQNHPYPNIALHIQDEDLTTACLVLNTEHYGRVHLTVTFRENYPVYAPKIKMDSNVVHPNIFGEDICASILDSKDGYTPAYTLKGIAIQLLSFFSSDSIEQDEFDVSIDLKAFKETEPLYHWGTQRPKFCCHKCSFGSSDYRDTKNSLSTHSLDTQKIDLIVDPDSQDKVLGDVSHMNISSPLELLSSLVSVTRTRGKLQSAELPDEILLMICENLETEELLLFAEAWTTIGKLLTNHDIIRSRELRCFCLKLDYRETELGFGVRVVKNGKFGTFESEFDILSQAAFDKYQIRRSVQGVPFSYWLPMPISHRHWNNVREVASKRLQVLARAAKLENVSDFRVLYHFMNDIVVKLNQETSQATTATHQSQHLWHMETAKSSLIHVSEKAIESYFHVFHLLLCVAAQGNAIAYANSTLRNFIRGKTSKKDCPNLGHLLVAALISNIEMTDIVVITIIKEAITRNVVWMLDAKGGNMPELSYLEPSEVSEYRLKHTFQASKTSYRLLMFLRLFQQTAVGKPRKSVVELQNEAFERHGAPPKGASKSLADGIKRIHQIKTFPDFLAAMGLKLPSKAYFTSFLRGCVQDSMKKGYSKMPISQKEALALRLLKEPDVEIADGSCVGDLPKVDMSQRSFFPGKMGG